MKILLYRLKKRNWKKWKNEKKKVKKIIFIKFLIFFIVTYILLFQIWIYSSSFCYVYKNTQKHLLKSAIVSFITS